jgi:uncharacterized membrane protein YkvA (DUF1232 family)
MAKSGFQLQVEELLGKYLKKFIQHFKNPSLPPEQRDILIGCFLYLLDDEDLIPDHIPNVGLLDDLALFIYFAEYLMKQTGMPGVLSPEELERDQLFLKQNEGMLFKIPTPSIQVIQKRGQEQVDIADLSNKLKEKYSQFGKVEV